MAYENLAVEQEGPVLYVTVNRPRVLNALNRATLGELERVLAGEASADGVRVVVFRGAGDRAFVAGADIHEMKDLSPYELYRFMQRGHQVFNGVARFPKPTVAAIQGFCLGGGLELALACDVRVGVPEARFGFPEIKLGIIPGWGGTKRLAEAVGAARARELIMTGRMIDGETALQMGIVQRLAPSRDELDGAVRALAEELAAYSPVTLQLLKGALDEAPRLTWEGLAEMEARTNAVCVSTEDGREGLAAFVEKRQPQFRGR